MLRYFIYNTSLFIFISPIHSPSSLNYIAVGNNAINDLRIWGSASPVVSTVAKADIFNDGSSISLYNFNGNKYDSNSNYYSVPTNASYVKAKFGFGVYLNGTNATMKLNSSGAKTISLWVNSSVLDAENPILGYGSSSFKLGTNSLYLHHANVNFYNAYLETGLATRMTNQWTHIVVSTTGSVIKTYVDGVEGLSINSNFDFNSPLIGYSDFGGYTNLTVDQVRIFNRPITAAEAQQLYNEQ